MLYLLNRLSKLYFYIEKILIFMQNLVVLTYLIKYLTLIGKIFIRIWNYYYILNEYQKLLTMLPSIEKYDNTYKFTLQVTSHIDGIAFHWFFLIPQQLTKWILSHRRCTIAMMKINLISQKAFLLKLVGNLKILVKNLVKSQLKPVFYEIQVRTWILIVSCPKTRIE